MGGRPGPRTLRAADAVLALGALLLFVDSFFHWERICISVVRVAPICVDFWTAWSGRGTFAGAVTAVLAAALFTWEAVAVLSGRLGRQSGPASMFRGVGDRQRAAISIALAAATIAFGAAKLAFVLADHSTYGSYVGAVLLLLIAAGAALKVRDARA